MSRRANGEGSIYQRKDGRWAASISIGGTKRKHFLGRDRATVAAQLAQALADQTRGVTVVSSNQSVGKYLDAWLASVKNSVRPRTYEAYDLCVRRLKPLIGKTRLTSLSPATIERACSDMLGSGLSGRSVQQTKTVLHGALEKAVRWGYLGRNPCTFTAPVRVEHKEMKTLREDEVRRLFEATTDDRLHALWVVLATAGLRLGEGLGLQWDDFDSQKGTLTVRRSLQRQREAGLQFVEPKTRMSRRTVYLPAGTVAALQAHRKRQLAERLLAGASWKDQGLVFCKWDGSPLDPSSTSIRFHRVLRDAGLPDVRVHDLRHTAATLHLAKGTHPKVVQEMLGHSTVTLTLDVYSHVIEGLHAEAAQKMDSLFAVPAASTAL